MIEPYVIKGVARLAARPEILPGSESLSVGQTAVHVGIAIDRGATQIAREELRMALRNLSGYISHRGLRSVGRRKEWIFPLDETRDEYVIGCVCRAA